MHILHIFLFSGLCLAGTVLVSSTRADEGTTISSFRIGGDSERTRFVFDFTGNLSNFNVFSLDDPYRVVIDLPQADFHVSPNVGHRGHGLVESYRYGLLMKGRSRIVLDIAHPVMIESSFIVAASENKPARFVLDLRMTDRETFRKRDTGQRRKPEAQTAVVGKEAVIPPQPVIRLLPVIVIDPGHGGVDPGALTNAKKRKGQVPEKDLVLSFARRLASYLRKTGKYEVIMTRDEDIFLPLAARVAIAREARADAFLSVHADKFHVDEVGGVTVYTVSDEASDAESEILAEKENKADLIAGLDLSDEPDEVSNILLDLVQHETRNFSIHLAQNVIESVRGVARLNKNPHRYAGFRVLMAPEVPSVLLEIGYLSNEEDVDNLSSAGWQDKVARSVSEAFSRYLSARSAVPSFVGE